MLEMSELPCAQTKIGIITVPKPGVHDWWHRRGHFLGNAYFSNSISNPAELTMRHRHAEAVGSIESRVFVCRNPTMWRGCGVAGHRPGWCADQMSVATIMWSKIGRLKRDQLKHQVSTKTDLNYLLRLTTLYNKE